VNSSTLATRARITYRQLDFWCSRGWLRPANGSNPGYGQSRDFTNSEAAVAATMGRLVAAGLPVPLAAELARAECWPVEIAPGITVEVAPLLPAEVR
jgi:DNA-binding transcriptional MerR regulator